MNRAFFDSTLNFNWDMLPIDRSLDPNKIQAYLSLLTEPDKSFISDLLTKTTYIRYSEFKQALLQSFQAFTQAIGHQDFYLMLPTNKIGSEHWLVTLLWSQLRKMNLRQIIDENCKLPLKGVTNILIIDDAIYTGNNTMGKIDGFTYFLAESLNMSQNEVGKYFKFHIVIPFITRFGTEATLSLCKNNNTQCIIHGIYYLPEILSLMNIKKYYPQIDINKYRLDEYDILYQKFGIEFLNMPAVYFDHKVASMISTFSTIYLEGRIPEDGNYGPLFKVNPSREKIEELERLYHKNNTHYAVM